MKIYQTDLRDNTYILPKIGLISKHICRYWRILRVMVSILALLIIFLFAFVESTHYYEIRTIKRHGGSVHGWGPLARTLDDYDLWQTREAVVKSGFLGNMRVVGFAQEENLPEEVVDAIQRLPNVAWLKLVGGCVQDEDLARISEIKSLTMLYLSDNDITDEGLRHLHDLPYLQHLDLGGTLVTDQGITELKKVIPSCDVSR